MLGGQTNTSLRRKRSSGHPMDEYDRLPAELRRWMASADLPWGASSVRRAYAKALRRKGNPKAALAELDRLQSEKIEKDARAIWGCEHPSAQKA
ncbi:MAG: DUF6525 family protein [Pseudomonadota bacterium]